mmetsp:Transcript_3550/g.6152  ORF Transcript_3550/g.6152 Transcript_3550/m.6152 type:complete len:277 (-) Transcript_3550:447-1277(-)
MAHWARILRQLEFTKTRNVRDTLGNTAVKIRSELLVTENGKSFFERKREPVTASYTVTTVVVKVLVADDALDTGEVCISRSVSLGQYAARVKDIERLVLHCSHVEACNSDNVKLVEIVLAIKPFLIPLEGLLDGFHRMLGLVAVAFVHKNAKVDFFAGACGKLILVHIKVTSYDSKEVAWLGPGVVPLHKMFSIFQVAPPGIVSVAKEVRELRFVSHDLDRVNRHVVRAVDERHNVAKPFCLALRADNAVGEVNAAKCGVLLRLEGYIDLHRIRFL